MKDFKMGIKDLVWIITLVVSVVGVYYTLNSKVQVLDLKVRQLEATHDVTNIEILQNDLTHVKNDINEIKTDIKEQFTLFNNYLLDE